MIPPNCECGHNMHAHCDADGYFTNSCQGILCRCIGYIGHSTLILDPGPATPGLETTNAD